jgi:hypothetical protein
MSNSNDQQFVEGDKQDEDLRRNPGIGQSSGAFAREGRLEDAEGDNTIEGDVENDPGSQAAINPDKLGRTNK